MSSDEQTIREHIYDEIYASKRTPLAAEIIRDAAKQFAGVQKAWLQRVLDTSNYDHVMVTFEEVLDEVVETFVWVELDKLKQKRVSHLTNLTLAAAATTKTVTQKTPQQKITAAELSTVMGNLTITHRSFKDAVTSGLQGQLTQEASSSLWTTVGRKNKPLMTTDTRRDEDKLQEEEYCRGR